MDIQQLTAPQHLTTLEALGQVQAFLRRYPIQGMPAVHWQAELASPSDPSGEAFWNWLMREKLVEPAASGWFFSMRGIAFAQSKGGDRLSPEAAWEKLAGLLTRVKAWNSAPEHLAPVRIRDVLLFGSMARPDTTSVGDCDAIVLWSPKSPTAQEAHRQWRQEQGLEAAFAQHGLERSAEAALGFLAAGDAFFSLEETGGSAVVLLDQDPGFALHSLLGRSWSPAELVSTQVDESAYEIEQGLLRAPPERVLHVQRQLRRTTLQDPASFEALGSLAQAWALPIQAQVLSGPSHKVAQLL